MNVTHARAADVCCYLFTISTTGLLLITHLFCFVSNNLRESSSVFDRQFDNQSALNSVRFIYVYH